MTESQHTPGPWRHDDVWGLIKDKTGKEVCALHSGIKANAHLIAAAPEMLEALEEALSVLQAVACHYGAMTSSEEGTETTKARNLAQDAIAKAKGETAQ